MCGLRMHWQCLASCLSMMACTAASFPAPADTAIERIYLNLDRDSDRHRRADLDVRPLGHRGLGTVAIMIIGEYLLGRWRAAEAM